MPEQLATTHRDYLQCLEEFGSIIGRGILLQSVSKRLDVTQKDVDGGLAEDDPIVIIQRKVTMLIRRRPFPTVRCSPNVSHRSASVMNNSTCNSYFIISLKESTATTGMDPSWRILYRPGFGRALFICTL